MSKQLTLSATLSVLAMASLAFSTVFTAPASGSGAHRAATAHGSLVQVMLSI